ncbi:MAG: chemotaxis protein CheW [Gammaproteobacteria bacterium]|nr:chemotaxis protein CheW [Gammaproteobacteria bacterium]NND38187.1 chemotaxis protein CheW [Pseudomonadales bacterium]MBT8150695.1 chemotaxis protein CheW [Gammaproteobacteria bacterium]NNL11693.1 chemotaxis protein CheW [Pseudomonadales bacterium]NNM10912.1 chemotaxis protein CheW [Pseudomonadales bacterium]
MQSLLGEAPTTHLEVMLLPLQTDNLLLPDVMVAEICDGGEITVKAGSPDWFVGYANWRGQSVPLISFEALNGAMPIAADQVQQIAVLESTLGHGHLPYYAVVLSGRPSILDVSDDQVRSYEGRPRGRAETISVMIEQKTAGIPNVDWVEQHLQTYILHG